MSSSLASSLASAAAAPPNDSEAALVDKLHSTILSLCASIESTAPDALLGIDETQPDILRRSFRLNATVTTRTAAVMQLGVALDTFVQSGDADQTLFFLSAFNNWASVVSTSLVDRWTRPLAAEHPVVAFVCLWGIGHLSSLPLTRFSAAATILRKWFDAKDLAPVAAQRALVLFIDLLESAEDMRQATRLFTVLTRRGVFSFPAYVRYTIQTGFDRPVATLDDERPSRARKHGFLLTHLPTLTNSDERLRHVVLRDQVPLELPRFGALGDDAVSTLPSAVEPNTLLVHAGVDVTPAIALFAAVELQPLRMSPPDARVTAATLAVDIALPAIDDEEGDDGYNGSSVGSMRRHDNRVTSLRVGLDARQHGSETIVSGLLGMLVGGGREFCLRISPRQGLAVHMRTDIP